MIRTSLAALSLVAVTGCGATEVRPSSSSRDDGLREAPASPAAPARVEVPPSPPAPLEVPGEEEVEAWAVEHQEVLIGLVGAQKKLENTTKAVEGYSETDYLLRIQIAAVELQTAVIKCMTIPSPPDPDLQPAWRESLEKFRTGANLMEAAGNSGDPDLYDQAVSELEAAAARFADMGELI